MRTPINPLEGLKLDGAAAFAGVLHVRTPINPLEGLKQRHLNRQTVTIDVRTPINPLEGLKHNKWQIVEIAAQRENTDQPA